MKKRKIDDIKDTKIVLPVVILVLGLLLLGLELLGYVGTLKYGIHFISDPLIVNAEQAGNSIAEYFSVLGDIPGVQEELNELRQRVTSYESRISYISILEEENIRLREELELANKEHIYVEAKVLGKVQENTLRVNTGSLQEVEVGDTVSVGYSFIGVVMDVTEKISVIRLPFSKSSIFEVWVSSDIDGESILSRAVVNGSGEENIYIENISKNVGVEEGDYVIINDERVIDNLVLGVISHLDDSPSKTSFNGIVTPLIDYQSLVSVFICIN